MTDPNTIGREPFIVVELDQDTCLNTYGVAPCEAAVGVTGDQKCFNSRVTCQDSDNYNKGALTLRFCKAVANAPRDAILFPSLLGVSSVPAELNVGGGDSSSNPLGTRASVTITLTDHPYHDRVVDRYWSEREYNAMEGGTFWSKWLARNPYYQGRAIRVLYGYVGQPLAEMKRRHYIIDKINGPTGGRVAITAKDPIKLLDFVRSQAPFASDGVLIQAVDSTSTEIRLGPSGIGSTYAAIGLGIINGEIIEYDRIGDVLAISGRAMHGTTISDGKIGDSFQQVLSYKNERVDLVIRDLLLTYTDFPSAFIDADAWYEEARLWASSLSVTALITEPTGVAQLIGELIQQTLCYIWWDELEQELRLKVLRPRLPQIDADPTPINDAANIVAGKTSIQDKPEDRVTQVWIYYDKINPTGGDDEKNYARLRVAFDGDAESANEYNEQRIKTIFARWLGQGNDASSLILARRILQRYRDTPKLFTFSLDMKDDSIRVADFVSFNHKDYVDYYGQPKTVPLQITSLEEVEPGHRNQMAARLAPVSFDRGPFIVGDDAPAYGAATAAEKFIGFWIAENGGTFGNGDPAYGFI